jgi:hypothetical protein
MHITREGTSLPRTYLPFTLVLKPRPIPSLSFPHTFDTRLYSTPISQKPTDNLTNITSTMYIFTLLIALMSVFVTSAPTVRPKHLRSLNLINTTTSCPPAKAPAPTYSRSGTSVAHPPSFPVHIPTVQSAHSRNTDMSHLRQGNAYCTNLNNIFGDFDGIVRSLEVQAGYRCSFYV